MRKILGFGFLLFAAMSGAAFAQSVGGAWSGEYTCAQGLTSMTLDVTQARNGRISALATFYANPKNPGVPSGCFTLTGRYTPATGKFVLKQSRWIQRPDESWFMIDLDGRIDKAGQAYHGDVGFPIDPGACTTFALQRVVGRPPRPPGACGDALTS